MAVGLRIDQYYPARIIQSGCCAGILTSDCNAYDFGAANAWLRKLGRLQEGLWGVEFFNHRLIRDTEAVVPRLLTRGEVTLEE